MLPFCWSEPCGLFLYLVLSYYLQAVFMLRFDTHDIGIWSKILLLKALREGDEMMNTGRLKQALPYYEKVMNAVDFKVLHYRYYVFEKLLNVLGWYISVVLLLLVNCWILVRKWTFNWTLFLVRSLLLYCWMFTKHTYM